MQRYAFAMEILPETTRGTFVTPTKPLCLVDDVSMPSPEYKTKTIKKMSGTGGQSYDVVLDPTNPKVSFSVAHWLPLAIKDSLDDVIGNLFTCCGLTGTAITSPDGFKYAPLTNGGKTFSAKLTSARFSTEYRYGEGQFDIAFALDEPLMVNFAFNLNQKDATAELDSADADNTLNVLALTGDSDVLYYNSANPATINGNPACITDVKFSQNNESAEEEPLCGKSRDIVDYAPKIELSQKLTKEFEASFNDMRDGTEFNIVIPVSDRDGVAKGQFVFPKCVVDTDNPNNSNGLLVLQRTLSCRSTNGDDNYYFEFYT